MLCFSVMIKLVYKIHFHTTFYSHEIQVYLHSKYIYIRSIFTFEIYTLEVYLHSKYIYIRNKSIFTLFVIQLYVFVILKLVRICAGLTAFNIVYLRILIFCIVRYIF